MTICDGVTMILRVGAVSNIPSPSSHTVTDKEFIDGVQGVLFKGQPSPLGERKTCWQVAFLIGLPVKSAFALLLTRVTEPLTEERM
ncbi:MAG: hypothetical protein HP043_02915 [Dialister sp.]|nr:hypothetical protein [Dialister sp.]